MKYLDYAPGTTISSILFAIQMMGSPMKYLDYAPGTVIVVRPVDRLNGRKPLRFYAESVRLLIIPWLYEYSERAKDYTRYEGISFAFEYFKR